MQKPVQSVTKDDDVIVSDQALTFEINKIHYHNHSRQLSSDRVLLEKPLQIKLLWTEAAVSNTRVFSITMRTPGQDKHLITGLLLAEGVIRAISDIETIHPERDDDLPPEQRSEHNRDSRYDNQWEVKLAKGVVPQLSSLERYQMTYSSCGLCGSTSLKSLELKNPPQLSEEKHWLAVANIHLMAEIMRTQQTLFKLTGGSHAAALFDQQNCLLDLQEDIGRHNAVDKLLGALLARTSLKSEPSKLCLLVSGRVSFEIVQKAVMSGIAVLIAVGAPSDLAILAAQRFNLTLIGFAGPQSFNLYHGEWRLQSSL